MGASASREKFRESVSSLVEVDVSPDDAEFWDELWKIPSTGEEVFELIPPAAARRLRDERFENLATLFTQATAQLCQIVETPYNIYFDQALNCVRVLTRILPFLLEKGDLGDGDANVEHLCWGVGASPPAEAGSGSRPAAGRKGEGGGGGGGGDDDDGQEPLALLVVHAAMHMLFLQQFTCDFYEEEGKAGPGGGGPDGRGAGPKPGSPSRDGRKEAAREADRKREAREDRLALADAGLVIRTAENGISLVPSPTSIIWSPGVGFAKEQVHDVGRRKYDKNRVEVLRLLLATCCDPLFSPADEYNPLASRWMAVAVAADAPNAICLFHSLLNTILSYEPSSVPYSSTFASDTHVQLVELSAQVLCVLLDCGNAGNADPVVDKNGDKVVDFEDAARPGFNIFRTLLARINSGKDLTFIYAGFVRLLRNVYESQNTYLPNSKARLECFQELLVLFWKLLEENPLFSTHILTQCDVNDVVTPICYLMYESRKDPARIGLVHICTFVVLKLSGERSFGVNLNKPFTSRLPCDLPLFSGSHADLITITLHKLIVNGAFKLVPLYSCFITIICNISPYWRRMSLVAAVKLVNLFELFASPKFLYSGENAHRHLSLLLEVFNNVVQYQFATNQHLVYAIIRRQDAFGRLANLDLTMAVSQCEKIYGDDTAGPYGVGQGAREIIGMNQTLTQTGTPVKDSAGRAEMGAASDEADPNGAAHFIPSQKWLDEVKATLPLETVTRLLQHLVPVVDDMCSRRNGVVDEKEILDMLSEVTMVGLLPVPHAIVIRKYQPNQYTALWFTAFMWGVLFLRNQDPFPMFDGDAIELFQVSITKDAG